MSNVPSGWTLVSLGQLGEWGSGGTPTRTNPAYYKGGTIPWLVIGDLNDEYVRQAKTYITQAGLSNSSAKLVPADSLLVAMYGSIGKLGITAIDCATNQAIAFCRPDLRMVTLRYLFHALYWAKPVLLSLGQGGAQQNISQGVLKSFQIPLAPLEEQTRIADQLDTLLARVNACNDHLDAIPGILKRFRHAVLATALAGTLPDAEEDQAIHTEPKTTKLSEIAVVGTGSTPLRSNGSFYAASGTPWVTSAATGKPLVTEAEQFVTSTAIAAHRLKTYPTGTLLVAMYGEGKTRGQVSELAIEATINQACAAICVEESKASRKFVKLALTANYLTMRELAEGGNQPNLNLTKIKDFEIPLPSLSEQDAIVRRAEALFKVLDRIEANYKTACAHAKRLASQTLAKAFRGELVEQNPRDESASALLERLAASQPTKASVSRGRPRFQPEVQLSAPETQPSDWVSLLDDAWAAPADPESEASMVWLTAVLRAWKKPMQERTARLASLLCQQPHLFITALPEDQAKLWLRLVGDEAKPLPTNVARFQPIMDKHWGQAIKNMRVRGDLIEAGTDTEATWTLGASAASIETAGWPDGRASFVVAHLRVHGIESILPSLEPAVLDFVNVRAA